MNYRSPSESLILVAVYHFVIPFGTVIGILIIWYLLTPEAQAQFAPQ